MRKSPNARRAGFTLVELLVVIGIIALLISILLPALNKARESARQVKCMSNMQQVQKALLMLTSENGGWMPTISGGSYVVRIGTSTNYRNATGTERDDHDLLSTTSDWLPWRRKIDPITDETNSDYFDANITFSPLTKYLGGKFVKHTSYAEANQVAVRLEDVFRCPSDNLVMRNNKDTGGRGAYRYSYSINAYYLNKPRASTGGPLVPQNGDGTRFDGKFNGKMSSIKKSSEKVLLVCEDEQSIDDGSFSPNPVQWDPSFAGYSTGRVNAVASRHELKKKNAKSVLDATVLNQDARGNVGFADGHVEFFSRKDALRQRHTGNPTADPTGF